MLRALRHQQPDFIPCSFMSFSALRRRCREDLFELVKAERAMGLDSFLFIPTASRAERAEHPDLRGLPVRFHPAVATKQWREQVPGSYPILHREYVTPAGSLRAAVRLAEDWPHGDHLPFMGDYSTSHAVKPLLAEPRELEALRYLLMPPSEQDIISFQQEAARARTFANQQEVLLVGGWGVGADMAAWLCGLQNLMVLIYDSPEFVGELLDVIHRWNKQRMSVVLSAPVDLFVRRGWYEGCDFIPPKLYREMILPALKAEAALAHERGALFGYICSSGLVPMLDFYLEAGIDVLIGIDPVQGTHTDMALIKKRVGSRICLWGGVSGAVTVEMDTEEQVRAAVAQAIATLGPTGFILSPVDNITEDTARTWRNLEVFVDEWRKRRRPPMRRQELGAP